MCLDTFNNVRRRFGVFCTAVRFRDAGTFGYFSKDIFQSASIFLQAMNVYKRIFTYADITLFSRFDTVCIGVLFPGTTAVWPSTHGLVTFDLAKQICILNIKVS